MEKTVLTKIRENIVTGDINIIDKDGHDLVFLSMVAGDENIALQLLENKYFDRTHLNRRENKTTKSREEEESLLATACYYACPKIVKVLLEDEEFIKQVGKGLNPYQALVEPFYEVETKKKNSWTVAKSYTIEEVEFVKKLEKSLEVRFSIFNELLKHEDISFGMMEFIKIHDITRKKFAEWGSTKLVPFPYDTSKTKNFVTQILKKVIKTRKKSDWMSLDNWGDYTLPKYMLDANSIDLFYDMLKREDFDINQTREPSKMEYRRTLATYALKNCINPENGRIYVSIDEIFVEKVNLLSSIILDDGKTLPVSGMFIAIGGTPQLSFLDDLDVMMKNGYIVTNDKMESSVKGLYGAGDVRYKDYYQIVTAVSDGAVAALSIKEEG